MKIHTTVRKMIPAIEERIR